MPDFLAFGPVATRRMFVAAGGMAFGVVGAFVGLLVGAAMSAHRSDAAQAIHVPPVTGEIISGFVTGAAVGVVTGILAGLVATWGLARRAPGRRRRMIGATVLGVAAGLVGIPFMGVGGYIGMGVGVYLGGQLLGGSGSKLDVAVGIVGGGFVAAAIALLMPHIGIDRIGDLEDVDLVVRWALVVVLPLVGAVVGYEARAARIENAR